MSEIVADYRPHVPGECELVNWTRDDGTPHGTRFTNIPVMYLREASEEEYLARFPHMRGKIDKERMHFWEVSVD